MNRLIGARFTLGRCFFHPGALRTADRGSAQFTLRRSFFHPVVKRPARQWLVTTGAMSVCAGKMVTEID